MRALLLCLVLCALGLLLARRSADLSAHEGPRLFPSAWTGDAEEAWRVAGGDRDWLDERRMPHRGAALRPVAPWDGRRDDLAVWPADFPSVAAAWRAIDRRMGE